MKERRFVSAPARAAVFCLAASTWLACSSTSGSSPASGDGGGDDATADGGGSTGAGGGSDGGGAEATPESSTSSEPCDASILLPTDGGAGAACGKCIEDHCASGLATCQLDCLCVSSIECLAANSNNYTVCPDALSAIGAGNPGLMAVAGCIANNCISMCNTTD